MKAMADAADKELLDLPANALLQQVTNAQEAERQRRASLAAREKDRNLAWWNHPVPPEDELWLFVDTATGLPVKPEMHNERGPVTKLASRWAEVCSQGRRWPSVGYASRHAKRVERSQSLTVLGGKHVHTRNRLPVSARAATPTCLSARFRPRM